MNTFWIGLAYIAGSVAGYYIGKGRTLQIVDETLAALMKSGYLRYITRKDGEVEIKKWNENESS
tara:strand:- start:4710 stop:4901 length:192 start_codon:yes stop_codon:yes gene_type:complete